MALHGCLVSVIVVVIGEILITLTPTTRARSRLRPAFVLRAAASDLVEGKRARTDLTPRWPIKQRCGVRRWAADASDGPPSRERETVGLGNLSMDRGDRLPLLSEAAVVINPLGLACAQHDELGHTPKNTPRDAHPRNAGDAVGSEISHRLTAV